MVMFVQTKDRPQGDYTYRLKSGMQIAAPETVIEIQADGDELLYIEKQFKNLPSTTNRVVRWHGEFARFIAYNLR